MAEALYSNHFVKKYSSGIVLLLINTSERWIGYHRYTNTRYGLFQDEDNIEEFETKDVEELLDKETRYMITNMQEKDQISFYWIPYNLIK